MVASAESVAPGGRGVYLDHAAGAPMRGSALAAYLEAAAVVGNPSAVHGHGQAARRLLESARERLAAVLDCEPIEVVLTSGGTESVGLAITGAFRAAVASGRRTLLIPEGEHAATIETADALTAEGAEIVGLPVDRDARLDPATLEHALRRHGPTAALVSFLWANNEVGSVNAVAELCSIASRHGVPTHVDAVAAFGSVPVSFRASGASAVSVSGHKVGGPVGIGALVVDRSIALEPVVRGGGQERGLRSGTQSVAAAVAFATAAEESVAELAGEGPRLAGLRDRAASALLAALPGSRIRGTDPAVPGARLPGNLHVTVPGVDGETLLFLFDAAGVSVSTGSACNAGVARLSHVLLAMGLTAAEAAGGLRITFGHTSTSADVDALLAAVPRIAALASRAA